MISREYQMSLKEFIMPLAPNTPVIDRRVEDIAIHGLCADSRQVKEGDVFFAYPGSETDSRQFIEQAANAGAAVILAEAGDLASDLALIKTDVPVIQIADLAQHIGVLANGFYQKPSEQMQLFGVTGTNGKTTCCYLLTQALSKLGMSTAIMGTIGSGPLDDLQPSSLTTPDALSIHRQLASWRDQGVTQVCMEVSSHGLVQGRVAGLSFFCGLFTNLSHDHLDFHGDMSRYRQAKEKLFVDFHTELVITNADDEVGAGLIDIANSDFIASYGNDADVSLINTQLTQSGMTLLLEAGELEFEVTTRLVGKVNIPNILLVVTTLLSLGTEVAEIQNIILCLEAAPGRMELYTKENFPSVIVDYSHTPDSLHKALDSIEHHCKGALWCVFGCGGDRDADKRSVMGRIAAQHSDFAVITNDNPRSESPEDIAKQIVEGTLAEHNRRAKKVEVILDRSQAIRLAIEQASAQDWVLIAGKGHEQTQTIGDQVRHFSDREQVLQVLGVAA